jgi:hypothetical protein
VAYKEIMEELHRAREEIYEETKDMSSEEFYAWVRREAESTIKKLDLPRATRPTIKRSKEK